MSLRSRLVLVINFWRVKLQSKLLLLKKLKFDKLSQTIAPLSTRGALELVAFNPNGGTSSSGTDLRSVREGWFQIEHSWARNGIYLLEYLDEDYRGYEFDLDGDLDDDLEVADNVPNKVGAHFAYLFL